LELKIEVPVEGSSDLHGWFGENIKPRLERIKTELKTKYGIQYSGYQVGLTYQEGDQSFYYKLIWYKTSLLPLSKRNESFEMKLGTMDILNKYGLTKDDIEELFLDFSDMGYHIKMLPESISIPTGAFRYRNEYNGLIVFVEGLGAKSHQPEISSLIRKVIKNCEKLGLIMDEPPKRVTQFMRPSNVKFTFKKV
jgi:hypothetical protein